MSALRPTPFLFIVLSFPLVAGARPGRTYTNPLSLTDPRTGPAVSCPDPAIISETAGGRNTWYLYCTGDALNSNDTNAGGGLANHLITIFRSTDLLHWTYIGDAFEKPPAWVSPRINLWAAAVKRFNGRYYLYYVAFETAPPLNGSAIGVAVSANPAGPWVDSGSPVIPPEDLPCCKGSRRWVIDPDVIEDDSGKRYITYGSYAGGISARRLSDDGLTSDPASEIQIAIDNRYEGATFYRHGGLYYVFVSAANCCNGPLTGYGVFAARSRSPLGPYLDAQGISLLDPSPGGTPVLAANGNKWVGPGGNVVFQDAAGRDYMLYHAVDQDAPYFDGHPGSTRRPALIDALDWVDDWPVVRGGYGPSDTPQPAPAAQPGQDAAPASPVRKDIQAGELLEAYSDEFNGSRLSSQWRFVHLSANISYKLTGSAFQVPTQGPDLNSDPAHVSLLAETAPPGSYLVETRLRTTIPPGPACCFNFAQGALLIYGNDRNSIKLNVFANYNTRQVEFGKQVGPVPENYPTYGSGLVGSPGTDTWLRIAVEPRTVYELYTAYSSNDGTTWIRGGTWTHRLGEAAMIAVAAQNAAGFLVEFDYVRVYALSAAEGTPRLVSPAQGNAGRSR